MRPSTSELALDVKRAFANTPLSPCTPRGRQSAGRIDLPGLPGFRGGRGQKSVGVLGDRFGDHFFFAHGFWGWGGRTRREGVVRAGGAMFEATHRCRGDAFMSRNHERFGAGAFARVVDCVCSRASSNAAAGRGNARKRPSKTTRNRIFTTQGFGDLDPF